MRYHQKLLQIFVGFKKLIKVTGGIGKKIIYKMRKNHQLIDSTVLVLNI